MRKLIVLLLFSPALFAQIQISSFQSNFIQTITNDQNKTLRYEGQIYYQEP
ncbi:MAG: outer membrane lipoprotein chaperone LolA, partial [Epsilonproteobacteria bacterium]|nr:outer membrane lipoprotein chaperone LolA [Campylobacterota bacterium]NPA64845.1 outer membrane lipoprotein chaperone LolA [Campylobacterota bacterium]